MRLALCFDIEGFQFTEKGAFMNTQLLCCSSAVIESKITFCSLFSTVNHEQYNINSRKMLRSLQISPLFLSNYRVHLQNLVMIESLI